VKLEEAIKSNKFRSEVHKAGLNILYTAWWLKTMTSKELKKYGLTSEQFNVLRILKGKHPEQMCVRDVVGRMIEKNSNVPRIIDRLELKKLVKRSTSPNDKRETAISLTEAGINILELATGKVNKVFEDTIVMKETSAEALNKLLEEIRKNER
jgi:DNA-binding MarR family transcriptional regulator